MTVCPKCKAEHIGRIGRFCRNCKEPFGGLSIGRTDVGQRTLEKMLADEAETPIPEKDKVP